MRGLRRIVVLAPLSVAACLAVPTLPPCACIVPPDARGALNMSLDSTPVAFDGSRQTPVGGGVRDDGTVTVTGFDVNTLRTVRIP